MASVWTYRQAAVVPVSWFCDSPSGNDLVALSPFCKRGSLQQGIVREWQATRKAIAICELVSRLAYFHSLAIGQGDLTPDRLLFDDEWHLRIDVLSRLLARGKCVSPPPVASGVYVTPELVKGEPGSI